MTTFVKEKEEALFPLLENEMERLADDSGIKQGLVSGIPIWEAFPVFQHQEKTLDIQISLRENARRSDSCACISVADPTIRFPDGSIKRPDISVFCSRPVERKTVCTQIPEAVIEIHGITDEMVEDAPTFQEVYPKIVQAIAGKDVVIYNADYDSYLLDNLIIRNGLDLPRFESWQA